MNLTRKFTMLLIIVIILPFILGITYIYIDTKNSLNKIQNDISNNNITAVNSYINSITEEQYQDYKAWTSWDEFYYAVKKNDKNWIKQNVLASAKQGTNLESFLIVDNDLNLIDYTNIPIDWMNNGYRSIPLFYKVSGKNHYASSTILTSEGLYISTITKINKVDDKNFQDSAGYVVFSRKFDQNEIDSGRKIMNLDMAIKFKNDILLSSGSNITEKINMNHDMNSNQIITSIHKEADGIKLLSQKTLYDTENNPIGVVYTQSSSKIWAYFAKNIKFMAITLIFLVILLSIVMFLWLKINVVQNIRKITNIIKSRDLRKLLNIKGSDEITELGKVFNEMVDDQKKVINNFVDSAGLISNTSNQIYNTTNILFNTSQDQSNQINNFVEKANSSNEGIQDIRNDMSLLAKNVNEVTDSISQMSNSIQDSSKGLEETSLSISKVFSSIEQMDLSIKSISKHSKDVESKAENTVAKAKEGNLSVISTINEMDSISNSVNELSSAIKKLSDSTEKIDDIIALIEDISEQTNLLSLNASIEAARAGDAGKGFAVVANSIRSLAEKSGEATKDISKIIQLVQEELESTVRITESCTGKVNEGVQFAKSTRKVFDDIFEAINTTSELVQEIALSLSKQEEGSKEVIYAIKKINIFINEISAVFEENATGTEEIVTSISSINKLSKNISLSTEKQAEASRAMVDLMQEISKDTLEVLNGSQDIALSIKNLNNQAEHLITVVKQFKVE